MATVVSNGVAVSSGYVETPTQGVEQTFVKLTHSGMNALASKIIILAAEAGELGILKDAAKSIGGVQKFVEGEKTQNPLEIALNAGHYKVVEYLAKEQPELITRDAIENLIQSEVSHKTDKDYTKALNQLIKNMPDELAKRIFWQKSYFIARYCK
ncbi:MAG UNVERIFIED_CONTAM: hypothetical protein LVQ98_03035 [Rickettsiaceae bacterium]|jgi:sulfur relay (sulfurtransferase) DsrC/TusE family protein